MKVKVYTMNSKKRFFFLCRFIFLLHAHGRCTFNNHTAED